ncbi:MULTISPECIES: hypothetical protein [Acidianus]|jgi:hypothetical protein|uniref:HEPN domain-containing protein n=2 Tax=Acidianus TaxID=12914 RepID=A0A650CUP9_ACIAM|nr:MULTISPECIES: hypothetical protein [Acidianus]AEE95075.1 conserved hypothetical protein [Acidianus hospitalis W1]MDT7900713.1 hypothetical protein [Acidianus sp.]MQL55839.1 hypothetical protein [Acidianus ambivalens]QGR21594.1 hypothetical protein D1866_06000 [Acidianus ambivalens]
MNSSALASEFLLRGTRTLKEATEAYNEGDLYYTLVRLDETLNNLASVILSLYGVYSVDGDSVNALSYLEETRDLDSSLKSLIKEIQDLDRQLSITNFIDESSLKSPSVVVRNAEVKTTLDRITKIFDKVQEVFDEFHS